MTIELLEQYLSLKSEIKGLEQRINKLDDKKRIEVSDIAKGSMTEWPYISRTFPIAGYPDSKNIIAQAERLEITRRNRLAKLLALENEIEEFIDTISDSQVRQIITYYYIDGHTWRKVARLIGHKKQDEQYPRRILDRYFEKCTFCTENAC